MGLFDRKKPQQPATPPATPPSAPAAPGWSDIATIRAEWPQSALDAAADMQKFQQALALYERDDYASMMHARRCSPPRWPTRCTVRASCMATTCPAPSTRRFTARSPGRPTAVPSRRARRRRHAWQ